MTEENKDRIYIQLDFRPLAEFCEVTLTYRTGKISALRSYGFSGFRGLYIVFMEDLSQLGFEMFPISDTSIMGYTTSFETFQYILNNFKSDQDVVMIANKVVKGEMNDLFTRSI